MARLRSILRLGLAVPIVLSLTASLGTLPTPASATPRAEPAETAGMMPGRRHGTDLAGTGPVRADIKTETTCSC